MFWDRSLSLMSPLSTADSDETHHRGLVLQFLLSSLFNAHRALLEGKQLLSAHPRFFPYDWSRASLGPLNQALEHLLLLKRAFPEMADEVKAVEACFFEALSASFDLSALKRIYTYLEPLLICCKEDENLMFFLLKSHKEIDSLMEEDHLYRLLFSLFPEGLSEWGEALCDCYHERGFFSVIPELKFFLAQLKETHG